MRRIVAATLVLMSYHVVGEAQTVAPDYYIFDMHLHPFGQGMGSGVKIGQQTDVSGNVRKVVEFDGTQCKPTDFRSAFDALVPAPASLPGCAGNYYYDYDKLFDLIITNIHGPSRIKRSMAITPSGARPTGFTPSSTGYCEDPANPGVACEGVFDTPTLLETPDLRALAAHDRLPMRGLDPDAVQASINSFGACDENDGFKESLDHLRANAHLFRWAGEQDHSCFGQNLLGDVTGTCPTAIGCPTPTPEMKALFSALRDWDTQAHGTVLSTHLPAGALNGNLYEPFDATTGICDADADGGDDCEANPNLACCKFKRVLEVACGAYRMTIHQTHGNIHLNMYLRGSLPLLEYFFKKYDSPTEGFYLMDIQYVFNPDPGSFFYYTQDAATSTPVEFIRWLLDPLVSRHLTIGSHIGLLNDGFIPDPNSAAGQIFGDKYSGWNAYWDEIFLRMWNEGTDPLGLGMSPEEVCTAIQNISHGNTERILRIAPLPGFDCGAPEMIAGLGPGAGATSNKSQVTGFRFDGATVQAGTTDFTAYSAGGYGVNVGAGLVDILPSRTATIFTAPGPGPLFGPQIRGWLPKDGGTARAKLNWFAYGTLRNGAKVATGDLDGDRLDEIVTTPGPGEVFGPHVRGWNFDAGKLSPIAKVSFFAYQTLKYGANASSADVEDPPDGFDEILTGPGPGAGFTAQVRGFNYDDGALGAFPWITAIAKINFIAYSQAMFGAVVAGGDFDQGTPQEEFVTAQGLEPTAQFGRAELKGWKLGPVQVAKSDPFKPPFPFNVSFGAHLATGFFRDCDSKQAGAQPCVAVIAGEGPSPNATTLVRGYRFAGVGQEFEAILPFDFEAFPSGSHFGASVASVPEDQPFNPLAAPTIEPIDQALARLFRMAAGVPDATTTDWSLDPAASVSIDEWRSDADKASVMTDLTFLTDNLSDLDPATVVATLEHARGTVADAIPSDFTRTSLLAEFDGLLAVYAAGDLRSGATVARFQFTVDERPRQVETSPLVPDTAYVVSSAIAPQGQSNSAIHKLGLRSGTILERVDVPGYVKDIAVSVPEGNLYDVRTTQHDHFEVVKCPSPCELPDCIPSETLPPFPPIIQPLPPPPSRCIIIRPEVHKLLDALGENPITQEFLAPSGRAGYRDPRVLILTPTIENPSAPAKAYISAASGLVTTALCPAGGVFGELIVIDDLAAMPNAEVSVIGQGLLYHDLAPSPIPGDPRIFALFECGMDIIDSTTDTISYLAIPGVGGSRLKGAEISSTAHRLFALDGDTVTSYDLEAASVAARITVQQALDIDVTPNGKTVVVLTGDSRLVLLDTTTLAATKTISIGQQGSAMVHVAVTADGTTALVSDEGKTLVEEVRIAKEVIAEQVEGVATVIGATPDSAFSPPNLARNRRKALVNKLSVVKMHVAQAEAEPDPKRKDQFLDQAVAKVENDILPKMDGFFGGDPQNDWIHTEEGQRLIVPLVKALVSRLEEEKSPRAPEVIP